MAACKHDARGIAQLMRLGWFKPVCVKTLPTQEVWAVLTACELLGEKLRDVDNSLRNILRGLGWKVGRLGKRGFAGRIELSIEAPPQSLVEHAPPEAVWPADVTSESDRVVERSTTGGCIPASGYVSP